MIKNHYKLLVLDVDGTLINKNGVISETDRQALAETQDKGIRVALCTGRTVKSCAGILDTLSLNGCHIFFDGALVYDHTQKQEVHSFLLPPETVSAMCQTALQEGIPLDLFSSTQYYVVEESWRTKIRRDSFGIESIVADFKTLWQREKIIKGGTVISSRDEESRFFAYISRFQDRLHFTRTVTPVFPDLSFINITAPEVSKGKALQGLASHLDIRTDEIMAVGDGTNDIPLLSAAGLGVAMQNAPDELKSVADYITADVEQSGVAQAVRKFLL